MEKNYLVMYVVTRRIYEEVQKELLELVNCVEESEDPESKKIEDLLIGVKRLASRGLPFKD